MTPAIHVEDLGKCYRVSHEHLRTSYRSLRESLVNLATAPVRSWLGGTTKNQTEDFWALKNVNLEVQPGEVVAIIGRNGAGKSTLLKILSRITKPTLGRITLRGRVASLLEVGTGFHPELTGRENIFLNGSILGMTRKEITRNFDEIVAFAEIEKFLDTPVKRYSSGMYVRLAFAVAAHLEPEILLVDEVLAVGDAAFQKKCIERMKSISDQGRTVLFVSHNMATVLNFCGRAYLLQKGNVEAEGPVARVVEKYVKLLASPAGGRIDLRAHPARHRRCLPLISGIRLINSQGEITDTFACGESLTVAFDLRPLQPLEQPHLGIGFDDALGQRIFSVATYLSSSQLPPVKKAVTVYCRLSELPLLPGTYTLSLSAGTVGAFLLDNLPRAVAIEVLPTDFLGNGSLPPSNLGQVLVRSHWEVAGESALNGRSIQ